MAAIDISNIYVGLEHFKAREDGVLCEFYELSTYYLEVFYESEKNARYVFYNWETEEEVYMDSHGNVLNWCDSPKEEIYSVTEIHSLKEIIDAFLFHMKTMKVETDDSLIDFRNIQKLLNESSDTNPPNVDASDAIRIAGMAKYLYTLGFGDPIAKESSAKCVIKFFNGR